MLSILNTLNEIKINSERKFKERIKFDKKNNNQEFMKSFLVEFKKKIVCFEYFGFNKLAKKPKTKNLKLDEIISSSETIYEAIDKLFSILAYSNKNTKYNFVLKKPEIIYENMPKTLVATFEIIEAIKEISSEIRHTFIFMGKRYQLAKDFSIESMIKTYKNIQNSLDKKNEEQKNIMYEVKDKIKWLKKNLNSPYLNILEEKKTLILYAGDSIVQNLNCVPLESEERKKWLTFKLKRS